VLYPLSYGGSRSFRGYQRRCLTPGSRRPNRGPTSLPDVADRAARVLVVDDDEVIRQLICVNLELEGFEVHTAVDGQDCLDKVSDVEPDVVTLDVMMPRLDGWETAARLREIDGLGDVKVVLLSARAQEADLERGSKIGVDAYLTKPFDPDDLVDTVRRLADEADLS
jgi:CheY-like chemotaxis protein